MRPELRADVIVVGAGPSGLAAAITCRRLGIERVVVLEREDEAGGIPRHCGHPPFGMREFKRVLSGPAYAARLADAAGRAGVTVLTQHHVVALEAAGRLRLSTPEGLRDAHATRVLLATGARETPRAARLVGGQRPIGVMNTGALQSHLYLRKLVPFRAPLIVGTELVSLSAVWSCLKAGIRPVAVVEANDWPTARRPLAWFPGLCGIPVLYGTQVAAIHGAARVSGVTLQDASGRRVERACDGVLFTGQFLPEASLVRASHLALDAASGGPLIDQQGRTSDPSYFAAGNLLRPIETAGWAFREGRRIGATIARDIGADSAGRAPAVAVTVGPHIKFAVPGRWRPGPPDAEGLSALQLRVTQAMRGVLVLRADGRDVWRRRMAALPERRILVPVPPLDAGVRSLWVGFESPASGN
ncbi:MAG TPA: FAD-dependent oxidoreductase [Burkholderiaceae bacterium]|jgi:thioredoxin reductase